MNLLLFKGDNTIFRKAVEAASGVLEIIFITYFVFALAMTYLFKFATVSGDSMKPSLNSGEHVLLTIFPSQLHNGDVVVIDSEYSTVLSDEKTLEIRNGLDKQIVKRVIAVGGQQIGIDFQTGEVKVNGKIIDEPYITTLTHNDSGAFTYDYPFIVPEGYIFVMGDNRYVSKDSRDASVGLVKSDSVIGKVLLVVFPFSQFRVV